MIETQPGENEKRNNYRYDYPGLIEYVTNPDEAHVVHKAVTINISSGGIGAYVFKRHDQGLKLYITSRLPIDCGMTTVSWIQEKGDGMYLVGLKCARPAPD